MPPFFQDCRKRSLISIIPSRANRWNRLARWIWTGSQSLSKYVMKSRQQSQTTCRMALDNQSLIGIFKKRKVSVFVLFFPSSFIGFWPSILCRSALLGSECLYYQWGARTSSNFHGSDTSCWLACEVHTFLQDIRVVWTVSGTHYCYEYLIVLIRCPIERGRRGGLAPVLSHLASDKTLLGLQYTSQQRWSPQNRLCSLVFSIKNDCGHRTATNPTTTRWR